MIIQFIIKDQVMHEYNLSWKEIKWYLCKEGIYFYCKVFNNKKNKLRIMAEALYEAEKWFEVEYFYIIFNNKKIKVTSSNYQFFALDGECFDILFFKGETV